MLNSYNLSKSTNEKSSPDQQNAASPDEFAEQITDYSISLIVGDVSLRLKKIVEEVCLDWEGRPVTMGPLSDGDLVFNYDLCVFKGDKEIIGMYIPDSSLKTIYQAIQKGAQASIQMLASLGGYSASCIAKTLE